jgi:hypothetical protein
MDGLPVARGYRSLPLPGSPAAQLRDDTAGLLASGLLPRCPHPGRPAFWFLPTGTLACAPCAGQLLAAAGGQADRCQACGGPATAVAAWVIGDVPCVGTLCVPCSTTGLVPEAPN